MSRNFLIFVGQVEFLWNVLHYFKLHLNVFFCRHLAGVYEVLLSVEYTFQESDLFLDELHHIHFLLTGIHFEEFV